MQLAKELAHINAAKQAIVPVEGEDPSKATDDVRLQQLSQSSEDPVTYITEKDKRLSYILQKAASMAYVVQVKINMADIQNDSVASLAEAWSSDAAAEELDASLIDRVYTDELVKYGFAYNKLTLLDVYRQIVVICILSKLAKDEDYGSLFSQLLDNLMFYTGLEINGHLGLTLTNEEMTELAASKLSKLQHTLLVTHNNQALNQLFEKFITLDVDKRRLLRLRRGEEELNTELSFSYLLTVVGRLAQSLAIGGEHGSTCETAGYFVSYHVVPIWKVYEQEGESKDPSELSIDMIKGLFPFGSFFSNAPAPPFSDCSATEDTLKAARGCFHHLSNLFEQLEVSVFELLKSSYDRANYLLTKEAMIIAMTRTHTALKRRKLASLGFKYDNIAIEEAAQILEVKTFIPMLLQEPEDGVNRLKRVIFIGVHNQLPPVAKNMTFQQYGNMEQSMFTRFEAAKAGQEFKDEEQEDSKGGKKSDKDKKKAKRKGNDDDDDKEEAKQAEDEGKNCEVESLVQMGEYVFGMMKEYCSSSMLYIPSVLMLIVCNPRRRKQEEEEEEEEENAMKVDK
ncbi:hypothetical protein BGW38_001167 [Lunasporangiospora selenospora]|uniref:Uncharacterized protein n=1 Tax=Lunasporangiospora selenospora TaxID=979761 RepID=A0A9P6FU98_9FUNG|nr:hypothetical protein BGW38_001167 [Lunasporangiospora selenospora]